MKLRSLVLSVGVLLLLVAIGAGLWLWKHPLWGPQGPPPGGAGFEMPEAVEVTPARTIEWQPTARLVGTVIALRSVTLSNEVAGTVKEVRFQSGDIVDAGQVLMTLDTSTEVADLAAMQAAVRVSEAATATADANVRLAESNFRRMDDALKSSAAPAMDTDKARTELETARAMLTRMQAEVEQARANVERMKAVIAKKQLVAPFRSRAGLRNVHPGQYLKEGTQIVSLQGLDDDIYVDFAVPQERSPDAQPGMEVVATSKLLGSEPLRIKVVAADSQVNPDTRNVRVRAVIDNKAGKLREGMSFDVEVPAGPKSIVTVVPAAAVRRAAFGDHVFVIAAEKPKDAPGAGPPGAPPGTPPGTPPGAPPGGGAGGEQLRARMRMVKLGPSIGDDVIVLEGLKAQEKVASAGSFKLKDGALVMAGPPPGNGTKPGEAGSPAKEASASK